MHKLLETRNRLASTQRPVQHRRVSLHRPQGGLTSHPAVWLGRAAFEYLKKILGAVLKQGVYLDALPLCLLLRMAGMTF